MEREVRSRGKKRERRGEVEGRREEGKKEAVRKVGIMELP